MRAAGACVRPGRTKRAAQIILDAQVHTLHTACAPVPAQTTAGMRSAPARARASGRNKSWCSGYAAHAYIFLMHAHAQYAYTLRPVCAPVYVQITAGMHAACACVRASRTHKAGGSDNIGSTNTYPSHSMCTSTHTHHSREAWCSCTCACVQDAQIRVLRRCCTCIYILMHAHTQ
jgi:hypothetical protein